MQTLENIVKIQSAYRTHKANDNLKNLKLRQKLLYNIHLNYENKNNKILSKYLHDWLHRTLMIKNNENANIIQNFCRRKMLLYKQKLAMLKLRELFKKYPKHKLANIMEKASRIIGGKGDVLYKTLQDILYRYPFDKFN